MNDDPQLIIFEPSKNPRTVVLNVKEDSDTDPTTIFDENGRTVTNYNVLYDEPQSVATCPDKKKIIAYIENWESQSSGNVITEKQARKIEKQKRIQAANIRKKERNKKRKAAMKSLIHRDIDRNALTNTKNVEEERAILQAMKMQNHSIKNVLNVKKNRNRFINLNTNYRPLENSTIELGCRKTPIDVVVLDSDEESESNDDSIQINIDPLPQIQCHNRITDDNVFRKGYSFLTSDSNARKSNKKVEIVQIVDSSDSDVECVSNGPSVESLSDDDTDICDSSTSKKTRLDSPADSVASKNVVNEEVNHELNSLVDSFVSKYIQNVMPILTGITPPLDTEPPTPQILITESISSQLTTSSSPPSKSTKSAKIVSENEIALPTPSSSSTKSKKKQNRRVAFDNAAEDAAAKDDELVIVEHESPEDDSIKIDLVDGSVQTDLHTSVNINPDGNQSTLDNLIEFKVASEEEADRSPSLIDFDSVPSPDYTPIENIPATASTIKAFVDFIRSQQEQGEKDKGDKTLSVVENSSSPVTKCIQRPTNQGQTLTHSTPSTSKRQSRPWLKHCWEKSEEIVEVNEHPINQQQQPSKLWQRHDNNNSNDTVETEPVANQKPWQNRRYDNEIQATEHNQLESSEKCAVPEIDRSEQFDKRRRSAPPARTLQINSAVEFLDKNLIRIGDSGNEQGNVRCNENHVTQQPVNCTRKFYPKKSLHWEPDGELDEQLENNSQHSPPDQKPFCQRGNRQCGTVPSYEKKEPWHYESGSEALAATTVCHEEENRWQYESELETSVSIVPPKKKESWQNESEPKAPVTAFRPKEKIPWQRSPELKAHVDNVRQNAYDYCRGSEGHQAQQNREPILDESHPSNMSDDRNRYHLESFVESYLENSASDGYTNSNRRRFNRNRYHPEPYEEEKFVPTSRFRPKFQQRRNTWHNINRNRTPYRDNRYHCNRQYGNGPQTSCSDNNFHEDKNYQSYFVTPNRGQKFYRYPPKTERFNQQPEEERQHWNNNNQQRSNSDQNNRYQSQPQKKTVQPTSFNEEELFTRRPNKFEFKANVSDFDDINVNDQWQQPSQRNFRNRDRNADFHQANDVQNYESKVARRLHSFTSNENTFSWENSGSCDFIPVNANQPVSSSPPWIHDHSNSDFNPNINALSRRVFINDAINSKT